jgi:CHAD domain-containing protein
VNETVSVPCDIPQAPAELLKRRFAGEAAGFASAAARVRCGQDPEAVHDLRVSARAVETMLRIWAALFEPHPRGAALRSLGRLRRRLVNARELEACIALLEAAIADHGDPVSSLLDELRRKLRERTARAARRLRPRRLRPLMDRIRAASASLAGRRARHARGLERARAYLLERRAAARTAVELALAGGDDWSLRRARLAIERWRLALDCADGAWDAGPDPRPALGRLEDLLGAIQDRAALIAAIERRHVDGDGSGLEALLGRLRSEKQHAFARFRERAARHGVPSPAPARIARLGCGRVGEPASNAPVSAGERWERMAQWLLGRGRGSA